MKIKDVIKKHKFTFFVYIILRLAVSVAAVFSLIGGKYQNFFVCMLCFVLFFAPSFVEKKLNIELPSALEIIIILFIFSSQILGEIQAFYIKYSFWDAMLHALNGFLCGAIGFSLLDIINKNPNTKFNLSPVYLAIVALCVSVTIGVVWEFFEFAADVFLHTDMQKDYIINNIYSVKLNGEAVNETVAITDIRQTVVNGQSLGIEGYLDIGLIDTMKDMIVNFIGAAVFSVIGFLYVKNRGRGWFAAKFIPYLKDKKEKRDLQSE